MKKRNNIDRITIIVTRIIGVLLLVFMIMWGGMYLLRSLKYEETNDAQIEAYLSPVNTRVVGYINKINFEENQRVNAGDTLVVIDSREFETDKKESEASILESNARLEYLTANESTNNRNMEVLRTQIAAAEIKMKCQEKEYLRYENLLRKGSTTQQQFEKVEAAFRVAALEYEGSRNKLRVLEARTLEIQKETSAVLAEIERKKAVLDNQKLKIQYTVVTAPFKGRIGKKNIQEGQLVQAGQTLVFIVNEDEKKWVVANFKETQIASFNIGQNVEIHVDAFPKEVFHGKIESMSPATGSRYSLLPPDNATGNFVKVIQRIPVKIDLTDPTEKTEKLSAGMNADVSVLK